jgi:hypothetical protein
MKIIWQIGSLNRETQTIKTIKWKFQHWNVQLPKLRIHKRYVKLRQKDHKFEANLGYILRPCLKKKQAKKKIH